MSILFKHKVNWKYAVGEVVLIFIGITLAIAFHNWNEERKDNGLKEAYILQLLENLQKDIEQLEENIGLNEFYDSESFYLLDFLKDRNKTPDFYHLKKCTLLSANVRVPEANQTVYKDLISTGNLRLFRNPEFKSLMDNYFNDSRQNMDEHLKKEFWERYVHEVIKYVDPLIWRTFHLNLKSPKYEGIVDVTQYHVKWEKMKESKELKIRLKKVLSSRANANNGVIDFLDKAIILNDYINNNKDNL